MIYLIGGAPRVGKSILSQRIAAQHATGWISTDILIELLRLQTGSVPDIEWNVPATIATSADWFFPYLERFVWGVSSLAQSYLIEGTHFLPGHVARLSAQVSLCCVFLGCSSMTRERFEQFPGQSKGYVGLPEDLQQRIVQHVPMHSEQIRRESEHFGFPYIDMVGDFEARLREADLALTAAMDRPSGVHHASP